ncbi:hypothetical protein DW083_04965 [Parabacteroides sp. AF48-14]|nr:hypothetical protein DW083_04965 [Parabacteroides sp. AF48-14]
MQPKPFIRLLWKINTKEMRQLTKSEMLTLKGGNAKSGGKWVYNPDTGKWYWVEVSISSEPNQISEK